jgi:hypothetical protein
MRRLMRDDDDEDDEDGDDRKDGKDGENCEGAVRSDEDRTRLTAHARSVSGIRSDVVAMTLSCSVG